MTISSPPRRAGSAKRSRSVVFGVRLEVLNPRQSTLLWITASSIWSAALRTKGASGLDTHCWRRLSTAFKAASSDLCHSLALLAKRLCTTFVDPKGIAPLLACRLIALDKCPGVRPIGICETQRRIIAKAVLLATKGDLLDAAGPRQLCAGQIAGIDAAAHGMRSLFSREDTEGVLLVDATNAFNSLNRQVALRNIRTTPVPIPCHHPHQHLQRAH